MTNEQILKKTFAKAYKNGYRPKFPVAMWFDNEFNYQGTLSYRDYYLMIFSPGFAKALWGEKKGCKMHDFGCLIPRYKCYLQQMVLEKDKLKYLKKFL